MGRRSEECSVESGAWEIALADLMTVLMVFFLVLWLMSMLEPGQRDELVASLMGEDVTEEVVLMGADGLLERESVLDKPPITAEEIRVSMRDAQKDITIEETADYIKITLRSDSFFESGRATINDEIRQELERLGKALVDRKQDISITGHTDNVPISNLQFPSNWELSASRAATVARVFVGMGVRSELVTISGRADNDPIAQNITTHGRSLNRRVIIMVDKHSTT